jgi:anti-anti-sigma regulatory factor
VFKVTVDGGRGTGLTLKLEGRLAAEWVDEFDRAVTAAMREDSAITLDLDGLTFADPRGVATIRSAVERGARLTRGSPFIGALIEQERTP